VNPAAESLAETMDSATEWERIRSESETGRFVITNPSSADWALRKLARVRGDVAQVDAVAEEQVATVRDWQQRERERLGHDEEFFCALLAEYHRDRLGEDERAKTIRLPHGELRARRTPAGIHIEDEDSFLRWAEEDGRFTYQVTRLDKRLVKDAVLKDGEVLPGVTPTEPTVRFTASTDSTEDEGEGQ
jgi:phage host-nuclease inhibitor protein Gam